MKLRTGFLDAIIFDSPQNLESHLEELEQIPENYINSSLFQKSYDEMTNEEKKNSVKQVKEYLEANCE